MTTFRKFVTSGVGFSFVVVGLTGVIFKLFFKNHPLEEIHGWIGLAFVAAAGVHIFHNWPSLRRHLIDWRVYLLLVPIVAVIAGISMSRGEERGGGGNPRAIMSKLAQGKTADVSKAFGKDVAQVLASMKADGLNVTDGDETVQDIAQQNHRPAEGILAYFAN